MKDIITSRIELLWAKIAGRNVNINTMTPPVASNMTEKLMLEVAERLDSTNANVVSIVDIQSTTPTITPECNTIYECGELTSLTISNPPSSGAYSIVFTSGSTATTKTIPATILGLESFEPAANTIYEINVLNNRAVVGSWAVSS